MNVSEIIMRLVEEAAERASVEMVITNGTRPENDGEGDFEIIQLNYHFSTQEGLHQHFLPSYWIVTVDEGDEIHLVRQALYDKMMEYLEEKPEICAK